MNKEKNIDICPKCKTSSWNSFYEGRIRNGSSFNFIEKALLIRCTSCGIVRLKEAFCVEDEEFYKTPVYRNSVNESVKHKDFYSKHDELQVQRLNLLTNSYRNKIIADVGCAGGGFLDFVSGLAKELIAIEPCESYHEGLKSKGYQVFGSTEEALESYKNKCQLVFSFSVIEHVQNPIEYLKQIYLLMDEEAELIISTPNLDDFLINLSPKYAEFFYRVAHRWYFDKDTLSNFCKYIGFKDIKVKCHHRFNFNNFVTWISDSRPSGNSTSRNYKFNTEMLDSVWRKNLEETYTADYLYISMKK